MYLRVFRPVRRGSFCEGSQLKSIELASNPISSLQQCLRLAGGPVCVDSLCSLRQQKKACLPLNCSIFFRLCVSYSVAPHCHTVQPHVDAHASLLTLKKIIIDEQ